MLIMRTTNIASIRLTTPIETADESKDKTTVYTKAVEGVYTKKINNTEETKEQNLSQYVPTVKVRCTG